MDVNNKKVFRAILFIVVVGLILDTILVLNLWKQVRSPENLTAILIKVTSNLPGYEGMSKELINNMDFLLNGQLGEKLEFMSKILGLLLLLCLIWDYIAYLFLFRYKNWARIYVFSIAVFYVLQTFFDFSLINLGYGLITIVLLFKHGAFFLKKKGSLK